MPTRESRSRAPSRRPTRRSDDGFRHHTEAKEAGSTGPRGISRTTGVTKSCTGAGDVAGWATGLLWEVAVGMNVASSQTTAMTSGSHPEHREPPSGDARPQLGRLRR